MPLPLPSSAGESVIVFQSDHVLWGVPVFPRKIFSAVVPDGRFCHWMKNEFPDFDFCTTKATLGAAGGVSGAGGSGVAG